MEHQKRTYRNTLRKIYSRIYSKNSKPLQSDDFTNCSDLPFLNFIKITVTGDLKWLGRCADPEALWQSIHSEYTELSGDTSNTRGLELAKQISYLTNRINITNMICYHLSIRGRIDELIDELKNMGYRLSYSDLDVDLKRTISLSKSDHVKLQAAQTQYDALETGEKVTEMSWYQTLSALAKHRQVNVINPALITVLEYICMQKEFSDYINAMKSAHR